MITALCSIVLATLPHQTPNLFRGSGESIGQFAQRTVPKGMKPTGQVFEEKACGAVKSALVLYFDASESAIGVAAVAQMPGQKPIKFDLGITLPKLKSVSSIFTAKTFVDGTKNAVIVGKDNTGKTKACVVNAFYDPEAPLAFDDPARIPAMPEGVTAAKADQIFASRLAGLWTSNGVQIPASFKSKAKKLNLTVVVPTYVPSGFKLISADCSLYEKKYGDAGIGYRNGKAELIIQMASEGIGDPMFDDDDEETKVIKIASPLLGTVDMAFGKPKTPRSFMCTWYALSAHSNPVFCMVMGKGVSEAEVSKFVLGLRLLKN